MLKIGCKLKYVGGEILGEDDLNIGDIFELESIESNTSGRFYHLNGCKYDITVLDEEIEFFEVL